jgi:hypothetical protein
MRFTFAILLIVTVSCNSTPISFDKEKWASGKGNFDGESPRDSMVSNAEEAGVKVGAARASIRALLGDPDSTGPNGDIWYLGRGYYVPNNQRLEILYDKNDIATKVSRLRT